MQNSCGYAENKRRGMFLNVASYFLSVDRCRSTSFIDVHACQLCVGAMCACRIAVAMLKMKGGVCF